MPNLPDSPDWTVRGLALPPALISLLRTGGWVHPGQQALARLMPWFEDPLWFMPDLREMRRENGALDSLADDGELFRLTRGGHPDRRLDPSWLDVDLAVLIAVNERAGDDVGVALDYRTDPADPRVVAADIWTDLTRYSWRLVTATFTELLTALGVAGSDRPAPDSR